MSDNGITKRAPRQTAASLATAMRAAPATQPVQATPVLSDSQKGVEEPPVPPAPPQDAPGNAAEAPQDAPQGPPEGEGSQQADQTTPGGSQGTPADGVAVIPAPQAPQIPVDKLFAPQRSTGLSAAALKRHTREITALLKSLDNIRKMLGERQVEYQEAVAEARSEGFPEEELNRLAVNFNWTVPIKGPN